MPELKENELSVIFSVDEVDVQGTIYKVGPWTLAQMVSVWPLLSTLLNEVKTKIGQEAWDSIIKSPSATDAFMGIFRDHFADVIGAVLPGVSLLLSKSLGITEQEAGALDMGTALNLLLRIVTKNVEHLKNSFAPFLVGITGLAENLTT